MKNSKFIVSMFMCITSMYSFAQPVPFVDLWNDKFQHTTTDDFANQGRKIVTDPLNLFVYTLTDVTSDISPGGTVTGLTYNYVSIIKYDNAGLILDQQDIDIGQHTVSGYEKRSSFGLEIDDNGDLFVGYNNYNSTTGFDVNLAKYDSNLNLLWLYTFNASSADAGIDMKLAASGTAYAILKSNSGGTDRSRVFKASGNGSTTSGIFTFTGFSDMFTSMDLDDNENVYVTGYRIVTGNMKVLSTASITSTGSLRWRRTDNCGNPNGNHFARHINYGADDGVYITGSSQGTVQHGIDVVVMKINKDNGKQVWQKLINVNLTDGGYFVTSHDLNIINVIWIAGNSVFIDQLTTAAGVLGRRAVYTPLPTTPYSSLNGITVSDYKVSNNGFVYFTGTILATSLTSQQFGTAFIGKLNYASRGSAKIESEYAIQGNTSTSMKGVTLALNETDERVYWQYDQYNNHTSHQNEFAAIQALEGLPGSSFKSITNNISVFPIPVVEIVTIQVEQHIASVRIFDLTGRILHESMLKSTDQYVRFNMETYPSGIYLATAYDTNGSPLETLKIVKE